MAETFKTTDGILIKNNRVFLPSDSINIFPCSRRGQYEVKDTPKYYDPEARLNTERTNRLHTAINGFKDSFIINENFTTGDILTFVLAGYLIEVKNFNPTTIASVLGTDAETSTVNIIYAHLSLHDNIALGVEGYSTEILYRQSTKNTDKNSLDVDYDGKDFFVGVSFTSTNTASDAAVTPYFLPLFSYDNSSWKLIQTSLLPKIEHGETEDSIKVTGDFTVEHDEQTSFKITKDETTLTNSFTIKQVSDEGEQTSFEITKHGVGNVNVPLHITKATAIDGLLNSTNATRTKSLIVGELIEGEIFPDEGTIKAKQCIETPTLEASTNVKTPVLDVETIENTQDTTGVKIEDNLNVTPGHIVSTDTIKVNTVNSRQENGTITVESPVELYGKAALNNGLEVTNGNTTLKGLSADKIDAAEITAGVSVKAPAFTQTIDSVENPVPAITLAEQSNGNWQLQIQRVTKKPKQA